MIRRPPRSTLFPTRRSSDLVNVKDGHTGKPARSAARWIEFNECGHPVPDERGVRGAQRIAEIASGAGDRKSTRLNSSHSQISYAVFCLKKKKNSPTVPAMIL